jgi:hypothetical protein
MKIKLLLTAITLELILSLTGLDDIFDVAEFLFLHQPYTIIQA